MSTKIEDIRHLIDNGALDQAQEKINELLELGPQNLQALKFKALLFSLKGMFGHEHKVWRKIVEIDPEDESAQNYFYRSFIEEKEFEYFTDYLPQGGRRYMANPRTMINPSFLGLFGCALFLFLSNMSQTHLILATQAVSMTLFLLLVVSPWILIVWTFLHSLRDISISSQGLAIRSRIKNFNFTWPDIAEAYIATEAPYSNLGIYLIIIPKRLDQKTICLEIGENSVIRATSFLVQDLTHFFRKPIHMSRQDIKASKKNIVRF